MEHYKEKGIESLKNCLPTIMFVKRINKLIDAMNSQQPSDGLKPDLLSNNNSVRNIKNAKNILRILFIIL